EVGDSDPGAPPIDPPDPNIGRAPVTKAPSARDLERLGATDDDKTEALRQVAQKSSREITAGLNERNASPDGSPSERNRRLVAFIAAELAEAHPKATVTPITEE